MIKIINTFIKSKFLINSAIYTIGSMMTPVVSLIMLPIFTSYLSPSEYGIMTTVQALVGMIQVFLSLSIGAAITRFFYDFIDKPDKQREYLGTIYLFTLLFATVVSVIMILLHKVFGNLFFENIPIKPFYFYLIGLSWVNALFELPMSLLRVQEKSLQFIGINTLKAFGTMGLTILLIIGFKLKAEGVLIAQIAIAFLIVIILYVKQARFLSFSLNRTYIKDSLQFCLPLLPHVASGWIISSSDRIILEKYTNLADVGIYALAAQVSIVLALFYSSVNNAFVPRFTVLKKEGKEIEAKKLLNLFFVMVVFFGIISIPIAMYGIQLFVSNNYVAAVPIIPYLILGQIIKGLYFIPVSKLFYYKRTKSIAMSSSIAAISNVVISLVAIPYIGIYGAIISTLISEILRLILIYKSSRYIT